MINIDIVIMWVDDRDPIWQESFKKYSGQENIFTDVSVNRYRDWDLLHFWFRGVEKYANWVNKIHFVTCGHYPAWLNLNHPKLNFVKHADFIPQEYLPTFNARPIELNLHRIKGLADKFIFFNDDMFIVNPTTPVTFFTKALPNDLAALTAYNGLEISKVRLNDIAVINKYFDKTKCMKENFTKWFNYKYSRDLIRTLLLMPWNGFTGMQDNHLPNSYLKSTFEEVWDKEFETLHSTCINKFRNNNTDVNQHLFKFWQLAKGEFHPFNKRGLGEYFALGSDDLFDIKRRFAKNKKPIVCMNDVKDENFEELKKAVFEIFNQRFPSKSEFELE